MTIARGRGRVLRVEGREDDVRGHRERHVGEDAEGREIVRSSSSRDASTTGSVEMAVGAGPAMAGHVLDHRQHAAGQQPLGRGPAEDRDLAGSGRRRGRRSRRGRRRPGTSSTGRQSTLMPTARRSCAISRAPRRVDLALTSGSLAWSRAVGAAPAGYFGQCGGPIRCTRPPSWSIRIGASPADASRAARRRAPSLAPGSRCCA